MASAKSVLYVPKRSHSMLIGRGGSVVQGLQTKYKVKIGIPRAEQDTSAIEVQGADAVVEQVRQEFESILGFSVGNQPLSKVYLNIPSGEMGMIIGRQGATIRQLQADTGCTVYVPRNTDPSQYVELEGSAAAVQAAEQAIGKLLGHAPARAGAAAVEQKQAVAAAAVAASKVGAKIDLTKPIYEALFYPDIDGSDGFSFDRFLAYLGTATSTMDICVFTLTDDRVKDTIVAAKKRGVKVRLITDNDTADAKGSDIQDLADAGIPTKTDNTEYHMHHKFCVIDGKLLISGSFNWTWSAAKNNQENQIITNNQSLIQQFSQHFEKMWADPQFVTKAASS